MEKKKRLADSPTSRECKWPEDRETGYCWNCKHTGGVDEENDVCICGLDSPHRDWRYNGNEPCPDWEPESSKSYSYQDLFPSTRQKLAAFRLFRKFNGSENTQENLIYFLCCSGISIDFLKFCAKNEGYDDLGLYLEATGCMVSIKELLHDA